MEDFKIYMIIVKLDRKFPNLAPDNLLPAGTTITSSPVKSRIYRS